MGETHKCGASDHTGGKLDRTRGNGREKTSVNKILERREQL